MKGFPKEKVTTEVCIHCLKNDHKSPCTKVRSNNCNQSGTVH